MSWLECAGHERIHLIDNDSTYPELLEYFETTPHRVHRLRENAGHLAPWDAGVVEREARGEWYVVTDPDVVPVPECPSDAVEHFREALLRYPRYFKAGFGLVIDDLPEHYEHAGARPAMGSAVLVAQVRAGLLPCGHRHDLRVVPAVAAGLRVRLVAIAAHRSSLRRPSSPLVQRFPLALGGRRVLPRSRPGRRDELADGDGIRITERFRGGTCD